ncbi:response regulator [Fontibacillus sp. BL9]|uniref:response regulator n=1 Tax=Fontibacillus sp. BL9 TaxID=3389971 RepID=UPI00397E815E
MAELKAILIDDENPALMQLERLLMADGRVRVAGKYTRAQSALDHLETEKAEVIFLDIDMPEMNGLEAAEVLKMIDPDVLIVYVTAYNHYAVEAFERNALDYLLKPVEPERLTKTVSRLEVQLLLQTNAVRENYSNELMVLCFKQLSWNEEDGAGGQIKWRTQKAQELFAFLVHHRNKRVTKEVILQTLWPELPVDKAVTQLHTSVYQVRKILKSKGGGIRVDYAYDSYQLVMGSVKTDVDMFRQVAGRQEVATLREWESLDRGLSLYRGDYLEEHDYFWAKPLAEELRLMYIKTSLLAVEYEQRTGRELRAVQRLEALTAIDPFSEELCRMLISLYAKLGDYVSLVRYYEAFVLFLREELDAYPEERTMQLYKNLMAY